MKDTGYESGAVNDCGLRIRHARRPDFDEICEIYEYARGQMKAAGNPDQWKDQYPPKELILADIDAQNSYVIEEDGTLCGVFYFCIGEDPNYRKIDGRWLNDRPCGVIHRIAGNGRRKGVLKLCLDFCRARISNIRIDTYKDNHIMQHLLEKYGFRKCGRRAPPRLSVGRGGISTCL